MDDQTPLDPMTALSHKIIRTSCGDDFDPFMLGNGSDPEPVIVRSCFYYAVVMTEKTTVMFDNFGRGGMCDMVPEEMVACWDTPALLESQGVSFSDLQTGTAQLREATLPKPFEIHNDLPSEDGYKTTTTVDDPPFSPRYEKRVSLTQLLVKDRELLKLLCETPGEDAEPEPTPKRAMRP